jgi:hypothetical protein
MHGHTTHIFSELHECLRLAFRRVFFLALVYIIKHAYAGHLDSFTHLRARSALHDRGILANLTSVADW